jgi:hypothetical protein
VEGKDVGFGRMGEKEKKGKGQSLERGRMRKHHGGVMYKRRQRLVRGGMRREGRQRWGREWR